MATPPDPPATPLEHPSGVESRVPGLLRTAAAYAWRIIAVGIVVRFAFSVLGQFHRIAVAVFLGLVMAAVLRPVAASSPATCPGRSRWPRPSSAASS